MNCPHCGNKLRVQTTAQEKGRMLRVLKCNNCSRKFATEEIAYHISSDRGLYLKQEAERLKYERVKMKAALPERFAKPKEPPKLKEKRKVAKSTKPVKTGEVYLTYDEIFEKFRSMTNWTDITDYRPYPLLDYSIIVWFKNGSEKAYQYEPENYRFVLIENAKTYEEILNEKARKRV